ncbi:MAG: hypothetical protein ACC628_17555 [Pirellulaceae bacterium]
MPQSLVIKLEYAGRQFDFQVDERDLQFGRAGEGKYYWMDGRPFRHRRGRSGPNFRACVDLWWHAVEEAGAAAEIDNQIQLVHAECYPLVNTAKSVQDIFVDAHLHHTADREYRIDEDDGRKRCSERTYLLPEDECERLRAVAHSRDLNRIRGELEGLFLGELPSTDEMPAYREAARAWIGNGVVEFRKGGHEGLQQYTQTVDEWIRKLRRRGGLDRVRRFLNMFSYECKVAFYGCYCSAWVEILKWLSQNREANTLGDRFMRLWHHQNRALESEDVRRDVFCGQVLALHPLSAVILTSPQHLTAIGGWIGHADYESITCVGRIADCPEYWSLVATIMTAAHEYDRSRCRWEELRGKATDVNTDTVAQHTRDDSTASVAILFEDYAAARGLVCPDCSAVLSYLKHEIRYDEEAVAAVDFCCSSCSHRTTIEISYADITA